MICPIVTFHEQCSEMYSVSPSASLLYPLIAFTIDLHHKVLV